MPAQAERITGNQYSTIVRQCQASFDDLDVFYLANRFTIPQLQHEIHTAEIKAIVADAYLDTPYQTDEDLFPWKDYTEACLEAIRWIRSSQPKPQPTANHIDVDDVKRRTDIIQIVSRYTTLRKSGNRYYGKCPIHDDRQPSLTVYPDEKRWWCFGCNQGGDVIAFIMQVEGLEFRETLQYLSGGVQ